MRRARAPRRNFRRCHAVAVGYTRSAFASATVSPQVRAGTTANAALALAVTVVAGLLADSFQRGVALSHGGEAIGHAPGSGANIVVALGIGSRVR